MSNPERMSNREHIERAIEEWNFVDATKLSFGEMVYFKYIKKTLKDFLSELKSNG